MADVRISNKSARACTIPASIVRAIQSLHSDVFIGSVQYVEADGELVDGKYHVFDIFAIDGRDLRMLPYEERAATYARLIARNKSVSVGGPLFDSIEAVECFYGTAAMLCGWRQLSCPDTSLCQTTCRVCF